MAFPGSQVLHTQSTAYRGRYNLASPSTWHHPICNRDPKLQMRYMVVFHSKSKRIGVFNNYSTVRLYLVFISTPFSTLGMNPSQIPEESHLT
jgi:hypothetical protein